MNNIPIPLLIANSYEDKLRISFANKALHRLFNYDYGELIGQDLDILVPESHRKEHHQMSFEYIKHPQPLGIGRDLFGLRKDGTVIPVEIGLYPYKRSVMAIVIDVTARHAKTLQTDLNSLNNKLKETVDKLDKYLNLD